MLFNSYAFILVFLPVMLTGWWVVFKKPTARLTFLAVMSWIFYSAFDDPKFEYFDLWFLHDGLILLPLMLASTTVDFWAGHAIVGMRERGSTAKAKRVLIVAMAFNLGILAVFKYLGFMFDSFSEVLHAFTGEGLAPMGEIILPIGISFYTFNSMSYTIDIYRGRVKPAKNILHYAAFVALFPHLIAGPIVRYSDVDEQLRNLQTRFTSAMAAVCAYFFVCGLFKKLVIADSIAPTVTRLFQNADELTMVSGWAAALGYTFQLYFDFSGYSDMAVGLAMLMGIRFPQNFNSPYKAMNISDFWRRWHISLSSWLRDYLYITLGGSRKGKILTLRNLFLTMFLGGLWHGAGWAFVLWGIGHGVLLVIHNLARSAGLVPPTAWMSRALTFVCVVCLWVPFNVGSLNLPIDSAGRILGAMAGFNGLGIGDFSRTIQVGTSVPIFYCAVVAALVVFVNAAPNTWEYRFRPTRRHAVAFGAMGASSFMLMAAPSPFLYFQF